MKKIFHILFWLLLLISSWAHAEKLWNGVEYGMPVAQVKAIFPESKTPSDPVSYKDGQKELLRIDWVEIAKNNFRVSFVFQSKKLVRVLLSLEKGHSFNEVMPVFNSLAEALRAKYGPEVGGEIDHGLVNRVEARWLSERVGINLRAMAVSETEAILEVNYQIDVTQDADKL